MSGAILLQFYASKAERKLIPERMSSSQRLLIEDIKDGLAKPSTFESFEDFRLPDDVAATDVDENGSCSVQCDILITD